MILQNASMTYNKTKKKLYDIREAILEHKSRCKHPYDILKDSEIRNFKIDR